MNVIRQVLVRVALWLLVSLPALWLLTHPVTISWLIPFARDPNAPGHVPSHFWPIILWCLIPSLLALRNWRGREAVTFGWIALLYSLWQAYCFNTAAHPARNPLLLWGLLPNTDSHYYLNNAVEIAEGIGIRSGFGARQLWPGFLALLHTGCNGDLKLMLALLTFMQAAVTYITWETLLKLLGRGGAFIWLCCVALFYRNYVVGILATEQLGLTLGMLAAATLLYGWKHRSFIGWVFGLVFLTFSLSARPGCYFVLALLGIATFWRFAAQADADRLDRRIARLSWRKGLLAVAVILVCFGFNTASFLNLVNPPRMASNFWFTLYGSAKGGTWSTAMRDFGGPAYSSDQLSTSVGEKELQTMTEKVKQAAINEVTARPGLIVNTAWRTWKHVIVNQTFFFEPSAKWWGKMLLVVSAIALLLCGAKQWSGVSDGSFYVLICLGVILSLPLAPPWDSGDRAYAATNPLLWLIPAVFFAWCARYLPILLPGKRHLPELTLSNEPRNCEMIRFSALAGVLLVLCAVLFPSILLVINRNRAMPRYSDLVSLETGSRDIREIPGALVLRNRGIIIAPRNSRTFVPVVARDDFDRGVPQGRHRPIGEFMKELPDGTYIALLGKPRYLICDPSVFRNGSVIPRIPLQDSSWMAYKYIMSISNNFPLTDRQVMLLCPPVASQTIFSQSAPNRP